MSGKLLSYSSDRVKNEALSWSTILMVLLVALFVVLRFWDITTYSLWGTEGFHMIGARQSWRDMFAYSLADFVHPPLLYPLLKLWIMIGGESLLWLKLFPVVTGVAVVVPFLLLCRELDFRLPEISLALLLVAVNGYLVHYAQELRGYSLFLFLAVCSYWLFIRYSKASGRAVGLLLVLTFVNLLAIYVHYFSWLVVGTEFLFLLLWKRQRVVAFGLSIIFLLLSFSPWIFLVIQEVRSLSSYDHWTPKPRLTDLLNLYVTFNGPLGDRYIKLLGLGLFGMPLLIWAAQLIRAGIRERQDEWLVFSWLALLAFLPVIALFLLSPWVEQAVWLDRYFIFVAIPYMMLVATAVYRLQPRWLRSTWVGAIVIWSLLAGFNDLRTNRIAWESPQLGSRLDWDGLIQQMIAAEANSPGPINVYTLTVVSGGYHTGDWALSTSINYFTYLYDDDRFQTVYARDVNALLDIVEEDHLWVGFFELEEFLTASPTTVLANHGYQLGETLVYEHRNDRLVLVQVWRD